jgi:hypothetical protein
LFFVSLRRFSGRLGGLLGLGHDRDGCRGLGGRLLGGTAGSDTGEELVDALAARTRPFTSGPCDGPWPACAVASARRRDCTQGLLVPAELVARLRGGCQLRLELYEVAAAQLLRDAFACLLGGYARLVLGGGEAPAQLVDRCPDGIHDAQQRVLPGAELLELHAQITPAGDQIG